MRNQKRVTQHSWGSRKRFWKNKLLGLTSGASKLDKRALAKNAVLAVIALALFGSIFTLGAFAWLSRDLPDPNSLSIREIPLSTKIYDNTGENLLYEIAGEEKRTLVTLDEIPQYVVWATLTAEDRKFYDHGGIDFKGIARAIFVDVITLSRNQGASTITQQLVKNAILTNEKTFTRKFKELILAVALERRYTKDEIMQLYLNEIPYGSRNYGIQAAAETYFNKPAVELTLAESATLAAIPQATTYYLNNPDELKSRRDWILGDMAELGYITQEEADAAMGEDTSIDLEIEDTNATHFVLWVKEQLEEEYTTKEVEQGGLTVITTINYDMQVAAQEAIVNNYEARGELYGFNNSGLVALDPKNGHILAMVGSRDYSDDEIDGKINVTVQPLQPGSSIKPIIYAAGFEKGYTPDSILWDVVTTFPSSTGAYTPKNYDLGEHGPVTIREAIQGSLNIPAVKMIYLIGVDSAINFAEKLGYSTLADRSRFGLSMVLGGAEVTLLDHVSAYSVFASEGTYREPISILKVTDSNGEVLQEYEDNKGEQVVDANITRMMSNILSDDVARAPFFGGGSYLTLGTRPVAAKTGTTNDYNDAWTIGYTPSLVAGVWTGNTDGSEMNRGSGGSTVAAPVWNEFMKSALEGTAVEYFTAPEIPTTGKAILDGEIPSELVVIDKASGKLATDRTPESYREEKNCGEYHTILHYVIPSDPKGKVPEENERDSAYTTWETAVQNYITTYNDKLKDGEAPLEACEVPTEEDDLHIKANEPEIKIDSPEKNDDLSREFKVDIEAGAPRGISRIEYQIDGTTIKTSSSSSGVNITLPSWVNVGSHTLKVIAYDNIDNSSGDEVDINVTEAGASASARITNPFSGQEIEMTGDAYTVVVEISNVSEVSALTLTANNLWTGASEIIHETSSPTSVNTILWTIAAEADYQITGTVVVGGETIDIKPVLATATKAPSAAEPPF